MQNFAVSATPGPACKWMLGKVVILLEIDPGTELSVSLTLFNVTHCGLAAVRTGMF